MSALLHERCFHHRDREAAARCPSCGRCFCRECVTEHDDRVVCAACLAAQAHAPRRTHPWLAAALAPLLAAGGALFAWWVFYAVGRMLIRIPATMHEGVFW